MLAASRPPGTLSMYTRRNRCLPTFHSTSTISRPSERATRSAAPRIFSKSTQRLPNHSRSAVHSNRRQQKSGLAPTHGATRFRAKIEYIPAALQKQDTAPRAKPLEVLHFLMDQHGLLQKDLADVFGTPIIVSEVLSGKRELNKDHIKRLSRRFNVSPELFF